MLSFVEEFYSLSRTPFPSSRDADSVLMTEPLREATRDIKKSLESGAEIVCLDGPSGMGKTSLFRALPRLLQGEYQVALLRHFNQSWNHMLNTIVSDLRLAGGVVSRDSLMAARARGRVLVLAVDDAEAVSSTAVDRICVLSRLLDDDDEPLVRVVLFADLVAAGRMSESPLLMQWLDPKHAHTLQPLPAEAMHSYIRARLRRAGWIGEPLFTPSACTVMHHSTAGNPRRVGAVCLELMERAATRGLARIAADFVFEVLGSSGDRRHMDAPSAGPRPAPAGPGNRTQGSAYGRRAADLEWRPLTAESIINSPSLDLCEQPQRRRTTSPEPIVARAPEWTGVASGARTLDPRGVALARRKSRSWLGKAGLLTAGIVLAAYLGRSELLFAYDFWAPALPLPAAVEAILPKSPSDALLGLLDAAERNASEVLRSTRRAG